MAPSPSVEAIAAIWAERLEHVYERIQHCHVWIDLPHRHRRRGAAFQVKIAVAIPGTEIAVTHGGESDVHLALADAFIAARRQLHDQVRIRRGDVKHHAA
jgi:ribosome-associated translation inhibitor RaiA